MDRTMSRPETSEPIDNGFDECHPLFRLIESFGAASWIALMGSEKLLYISPAAEKIFGRTKTDLVADPESYGLTNVRTGF